MKKLFKYGLIATLLPNIFFAKELVIKKENIEIKLQLKEEEIPLDLNLLVREVVKRNATAMQQLLKAKTKENEKLAETYVLEPVFSATVSHGRQKVKTSDEDSFASILGNGNTYESKASNFEAGVSGFLSDGGRWDFRLINSVLNSNVTERQSPNSDHEHRTYLKASLEQPLLKGFGEDVTFIKFQMAKINEDMEINQYEKILTDLIGVTVQTYWQLYGAKKIYESWENLVKVTNENYNTVKNMVSSGRIAQTDLLEIENNLYLRQTELIEAKDRVVKVRNKIFTLLNLRVDANSKIFFKLIENVNKSEKIPTLEKSFEKALDNWSDYKIAQNKLKYELSQKKYLENQILPKLNLKLDLSSQTLNGTRSESIKELKDNEYYTWNVGVEFSVPIFGDQKLKKSIENNKLNIIKANLEIDSLSKTLNNSLHTKIEKLKNTKKQMDYFKRGLDIKRQLLDLENEKMILGKTSVRELLKDQEEIITYERRMYERVINWKISEAVLQKAMGTLLKKYNIKLDMNNIDKKVTLSTTSKTIEFK